MKFDVLTLFPDMFIHVLNESIIGRAQEKGVIKINTINIRDYSTDKHKKVDDYPYGGGSGMVMTAQPVYDAYLSVVRNIENKPKVIYMSPQGRTLCQELVKDIAALQHVVLLCGHYEGLDQRVIDEIVDEEVSIGDYVVTGGELPAMILIDAVSRMIPGVLSGEEAYSEESHFSGILEYPQYTRPDVYMNKKVPNILLSGHHANIEKWRRQQALKNTLLKRPDLLENAELNEEDKEFLRNIIR